MLSLTCGVANTDRDNENRILHHFAMRRIGATRTPAPIYISLGTTELSHTLVDGICLTLIIGIVRHSGFAPAAALSFFFADKGCHRT
jgi:hypothetical protein